MRGRYDTSRGEGGCGLRGECGKDDRKASLDLRWLLSRGLFGSVAQSDGGSVVMSSP